MTGTIDLRTAIETAIAPVGLTEDERTKLTEALQQLPELLAEAQAMRGAQPPSGGPQTATTPGSKPPCEDMTITELRAIINETSRDMTVALTRILDILDSREPRP